RRHAVDVPAELTAPGGVHGGHVHDDEAVHDLRVQQREQHDDLAAHGVADDDPRLLPADGGEVLGEDLGHVHVVEVLGPRRAPVVGQVEGGRPGDVLQPLGDLAPVASLAEQAVAEGDPWPRLTRARVVQAHRTSLPEELLEPLRQLGGVDLGGVGHAGPLPTAAEGGPGRAGGTLPGALFGLPLLLGPLGGVAGLALLLALLGLALLRPPPAPPPGAPGIPGMPPPRAICFIIFCAWPKRSRSWLTSLTCTPEPLAMRARREPLICLGWLRSK